MLKFFFIFALFASIQVFIKLQLYSLQKKGSENYLYFQALNYDYSTYKPHHYDVPKLDLNKIPLEKFKSMVLENNQPLSTERYPNYMRGSESFSGKFQRKYYQ